MGIGNHFVTNVILKGLNHVGAGADCAGLHVLGSFYVKDAHGGIGQACCHVRIGLFGFDGNSAGRIVSRNHCFKIQELLRFGGTFLTGFADPVQVFLNLGGGHISAVAELDALFHLKYPGLVTVTGSSGFRQLGNRFYVVIKAEQGLAYAKAAAVPGGVGLQGRVDGAVGIHLAAKS